MQVDRPRLQRRGRPSPRSGRLVFEDLQQLRRARAVSSVVQRLRLGLGERVEPSQGIDPGSVILAQIRPWGGAVIEIDSQLDETSAQLNELWHELGVDLLEHADTVDRLVTQILEMDGDSRIAAEGMQERLDGNQELDRPLLSGERLDLSIQQRQCGVHGVHSGSLTDGRAARFRPMPSERSRMDPMTPRTAPVWWSI